MIVRRHIAFLLAIQLALFGVLAMVHHAQHGTVNEDCTWCPVLDHADRGVPPSIVQVHEPALRHQLAEHVLQLLRPLAFVPVFFARGPPHSPIV